MRIISGKYKNKELKSPNTIATHPMGERERIAIFNMLGDITSKNVLDIFAGTGALGLEALSRGAAKAVFVENNSKTLSALRENASDIENTKIIKANAYKYIPNEKFDIIFVDPPYDQFDPTILQHKKHLKKGGIMVVSSPSPLSLNSRKYANCYITLLK